MTFDCVKNTAALAGVAAMLVVSGSAYANPPSNIADLVDARASSGESAMQSRGWEMHHSSPSDAGRYSYWWRASTKKCARVLTSDGRYAAIKEVSASDCGRKGNDNTAAIAIGAAALIGVAALASKSHHRDDRDYDERGTADFERGYRDGLYHQGYHNYSSASEYSHGYSAGVEERNHKTSYRSGYDSRGGYSSHSGYRDLVGRSNSYVDSELGRRGYRYMGKDELSSGHERTYWNRSTKQCISVRTRSGDVDDIHSIPKRNCR